MNFSKKGIDQQTGMLLSGHKTASAYRRYNIPIVEILKKAAEKLESDASLEPTGTISDTVSDFKEKIATSSDRKQDSSGG